MSFSTNIPTASTTAPSASGCPTPTMLPPQPSSITRPATTAARAASPSSTATQKSINGWTLAPNPVQPIRPPCHLASPHPTTPPCSGSSTILPPPNNQEYVDMDNRCLDGDPRNGVGFS